MGQNELPLMNVHIDGTPDVPDIVHPGDWITDGHFLHYVMVIKISRRREGQWDYVPGAKSWTIHYLGIGYMTGETVSMHDCGEVNGVVAVAGKLLQLYKLGWNETEIQITSKPDCVVVSKSVNELIKRENSTDIDTHPLALYPTQLSLWS